MAKSKYNHGTLTLLLVYTNDGDLVGHGYLIWHGDHIHGPFLSNPFGKPLPEDWYQLKSMEQFPTIWNDTVH
jgi:hypothetical protein